MSGSTFTSDGVRFLLFKTDKGFKVKLYEPDDGDWDYDDEDHAREMSRDVRDCRSYEEALEVLFDG